MRIHHTAADHDHNCRDDDDACGVPHRGALAESAPAAAGWDLEGPSGVPSSSWNRRRLSPRHFSELATMAEKNARSSPLIVRVCPVTVNPALVRISLPLSRRSLCPTPVDADGRPGCCSRPLAGPLDARGCPARGILLVAIFGGDG